MQGEGLRWLPRGCLAVPGCYRPPLQAFMRILCMQGACGLLFGSQGAGCRSGAAGCGFLKRVETLGYGLHNLMACAGLECSWVIDLTWLLAWGWGSYCW